MPANENPRPVYIPAGQYLLTAIAIRCSGLLLYGAGAGGEPGGRGGTQLCSANSSEPMLTVGTPMKPLARVTLEDFQLSGHCGRTFPPGGITMACLYCHLNRVSVTGFDNFGIEFTGASSECCGFNDVNQMEIQVSERTRAPTYAFVIRSLNAGRGGPDGISVINSTVNAGCRSDGNGFVRFETPGDDIAASSGWIGNRFEARCDRAFNAILGTMQLARFVSNRWENTGGGGLQITLDNPVTIDPPAIFTGNVWACGTGNCTYEDHTGRSVRSQEYFGSTTTSSPMFTTPTAAGGNSAVTLTNQTVPLPPTRLINARTIPGAGLYRAIVSLILTTQGTDGAISATIGWHNGTLLQQNMTKGLKTTDPVGTEVDTSFLLYSAVNQDITYSVSFLGVTGQPQYALRIRVEYISP